MIRDIGALKINDFDVLVLGGGINGCAIARDAALRGAKVALIEKNDFASGASGKSTKLIHGGIRYLEQLNFKLVFEALRERAILIKTAPHLVKPLDFIIPVYGRDPRSLLEMRAGVFIYDLLAGRDKIRPHQTLSKDEIQRLEGDLVIDDLKGGVTYYDGQMDDVRLCLENAISAYTHGCCIANKVEISGIIKKNGKICKVEAEDKLTQEKFLMQAKIVINATGAWSNQIVRLDMPDAAAITRPTKGTHIVYKKLPHTRALLISAYSDKRIIFIMPWRGNTLIGTTDTDFSGSPDEVYATRQEVEYLLAEVRRVFPGEQIDKMNIITTFSGLRPLVNDRRKSESKVTREHVIKESKSGLISVVGGKFTTYRHLAEQVVNTALAKLKSKKFKPCVTAEVELSSTYRKVENESLNEQVKRAVKEEMANTLSDVFTRRLQFCFTQSGGIEHIKECAQTMAEILGWSDRRKLTEMQEYKEEIKKNKSWG